MKYLIRLLIPFCFALGFVYQCNAQGVVENGAQRSAAPQGSVGTAPTNPTLVNDDERAAFKAGRLFVFTTGNNGVGTNPGLQVAANSYLNVRICNTSATRTWYISGEPDGPGRFIDSTSSVITEYYGVNNPDALTSTQAATLSAGNSSSGSNIGRPGTAQSDIAFTFGVGTAMTCNSGATCVPTGNGLIYPNQKNEITKPRGILPGTCFGQELVGQSTGGGLVTTPSAIYLIYRAYLYYDQ